MVALLAAASMALMSEMFGRSAELLSHSPGFAARVLITETILAALVLPAAAALAGARAVPSAAEKGMLQEELLTLLTPGELCAGRLLAALLLPASCAALPCMLWLAALAAAPFQIHHGGAIAPILLAHGAVLATLFMTGSAAFLGAIYRPGGVAVVRGLVAGLMLIALCTLGLFGVDGRVRTLRDPTRLIEASLAVNPAAVVAAALHFDIVRVDVVYRYTNAPDYPFQYPPAGASAALFITAGLLFHAASALRMRRWLR
jgi:hypothetical protein